MTYIVAISAYLVLLTIFGLIVARKKVKTSDDMVTGGHRIPFIILVGTLLATWCGGGGITGSASVVYTGGPWVGLITFAAPPIGIILLYFIAGKVRKSNKVTVPEIMGARYGKAASIIAALCDGAFRSTSNAVERYQEKTGAMGHRLMAATDEQIARLGLTAAEEAAQSAAEEEFEADNVDGDVQPMEPDEIIAALRNPEVREILAAANQTMADQLKEETDKLLDSVLYTRSMEMKNGFHMSDF